MKKRIVDIFGVSFIDLMAGALGAVLILFIVIPKVTVEQYNEIQQVKELQMELNRVIDIVKKLEHAQDGNILEMIREKFKELGDQIKKIKTQVRALAAKNSALKAEKTRLSGRVDRMKEKIQQQQKAHQDQVASLQKVIQEKEKKIRAAGQHDVGFRFKGRKIVFVIDVSGSMKEYDKIGQVKAGLKMLLSMMNSNYSIAVLIFPDAINDKNSRPLWYGYRVMDQVSRRQANLAFLNVMAEGGTPTRFALRNASKLWPDATDLVLLSDGKPMPSRNSTTQDPMDDLPDLVREVTGRNQGRMAIHTIGVGPEFSRNSDAPAVWFLRELAARNNGFYTGF